MSPIPHRLSTADSQVTDSLAMIPRSQRIIALIDTRRPGGLSPLLIELAQRDRASVVLYDLGTGSRWTTPFETDDARRGVGDRVLSARQLEAFCHHAAARAVSDLSRAGVSAGAYLATRPAAEELGELVWARRSDLVVALSLLSGRTLRNVHRVRYYGAALVVGNSTHALTMHPPLAAEAVALETTQEGIGIHSIRLRRLPTMLR